MSGQYPDVLPVVPLAKKVLLPSVVIKVILRGPEATILVRKHFQYQEHKQKTLYLGGIPFDPLDSKNTSPTSHSSSNTTAATSSSQEAPPVPLPAPGIRANDTKNKESDKSATSSGGEVAQLSSLLYDHGCLARILRIQRLGEGVFGVFLKGLARFKVENYIQVNQVFSARVSYPTAWQLREKVSTAEDDMIAFKALAREFVAKMRDLQIPQSLVQQLAHMVNTQPAPVMADMLMCIIETSYEEKLSILATFSVSERLKKASEWMTRQLHVLKISEQINSSVEGNLSKKQREFYLRQQLEEIKKELGNTSSQDASGKEDEDDLDALKRRIAEARLPNDALAVAQRELKRIQHLQPASTEYAVSRNYLELLAEMPWNRFTEDVLDIAKTRKQLDNDHFGLDHVKKRIIEYLSVVKIKRDLKAPIICFVGPPGVGKTSLGKSIAAALKRKFHRISLGGVRDEADMRGHRRTYVGAMPGLIIQGIRRCGVNNPVFLLDEVDKLAHSTIYGDPAAALLEILDPEQNNAFHDHYLNTSYDLSKVLFIATANTLETIPAPLLDRMEVIQLHGYTYDEKLHIARTHLLPKQIKHHGLAMDQIVISDRTLSKLAEEYTCESGVRNLERVIAAVVRGKCVQLAELYEDGREAEYTPKVTYNDIVDMFGAPTFEKEIAEREAVPGTVTGLAYSGSGNGGILIVEATKMPGKGDVRLTGSLGQVIQESAHIALSWIKAHAFELRIATHAHENITNHTDIHIHFPRGSVPKDGPSAGVTLACALVSLFSGQCVPTTTAMTGEISLRGQVLPVGGIKEKIVSAHRAGIRKIVLPIRNRKDVEADVPDSVKADVEFVYAKTIWDVLEAAFLLSHRTEKRTTRSLESHL